MKLYKTKSRNLLETEEQFFEISGDWDDIVNQQDLFHFLKKQKEKEVSKEEAERSIREEILPPIGHQEVWAAGVTYLQSRDARKEEAEEAGGGGFYERVYDAERPELFFKSLAHRVAGPGQNINIRSDSTWNVPEPELTLFINRQGEIAGYTVGNDMSSRSIEGENPLYLPQAKVYERSAGVGPCLYVSEKEIPQDTKIKMAIEREGETVFSGEIELSQMKRSLKELATYLNMGFEFDYGSYLMTGTCLVPGNGFTLEEGDKVDIYIQNIGMLSNTVAIYKT